MSHQLLDSISLSEGQKKEVCNDMCSFLNAQSVHLPRRCILLIEDINSAGINREEMRALQQKDSVRQNNQVSLSSLLNAINGVSSSDGRVLVMITNCQDQLDAALIHSECVDKKVKFTLMLMKQIQSIFQHMYIHEGHTNPAEMAAEFAKHDDSTSTVREAQEQFTTKE
ncbi:mitochondrial chaperone bcs1 [Blastomyces dermatitidis ER-3]|uniref:Mitochondrial chaperone bcs1 n=1 Tax=Ajellomyces dermatitidis (strain ER-3 / ATCC MYA-2586) TaxID=559297 RepID=A0ABP2F2T4_AJEDR|nr:mitochondrial chaperone bcs1 [Blastomyces dermatitidis ER-3]EEQ91151.2 mitochondrial chaperone bcs1 [Blastomyces dermatitidis ER-3]